MDIYYQNTGGLRTKTVVFKNNIVVSNFDIVCITETWLKNVINNNELFDERYIVYRNDRNHTLNKKDGGGVLIGVNTDTIPKSNVINFDNECLAEQIWISVPVINSAIHICCVYLPPVCDIEIFESHLRSIENVNLRYPEDDIVVVGDYNCRLFNDYV